MQVKAWIERRSPYQSLALLAVPLAVVEPLKVAAILVAGKGHWFTGIVVEVAAYAASLFLTHWVFKIVKPKLLTLRWFARLWLKLSNLWRRLLRRKRRIVQRLS